MSTAKKQTNRLSTNSQTFTYEITRASADSPWKLKKSPLENHSEDDNDSSLCEPKEFEPEIIDVFTSHKNSSKTTEIPLTEPVESIQTKFASKISSAVNHKEKIRVEDRLISAGKKYATQAKKRFLENLAKKQQEENYIMSKNIHSKYFIIGFLQRKN